MQKGGDVLRLMWVIQVLVCVSLFSTDVRNIAFPDGTTRPQVFIVILILFVWDDVLRIKKRVEEG